MRRILALIFICLIYAQAFTQDIDYAKSIIKTMCSPDFHGRGYVKKGDKIAADFLKEEIKSIGLNAVDGNYLQKFTFPVNSFPSSMMVKIDGDELVPGVDYLVQPSSSSQKGEFKLAWINKKVVDHGTALKNMLSNELTDYFIVIDTTGVKDAGILELIDFIKSDNPIKAAGIIEIVNSKLTYRVSTSKKSFPFIQINNSKLSPENKNITVKIKSKFQKKHKAYNVVGYIPGQTDSFLVFTAHYDHLGRMGKETYFPGAHDNASGCAMILDIARKYKTQKEKPYYSIAFIWFAAEEAGLLGSRHFAENPLFPLSKIKFLYNIDMVSSGEDGIKVVNGKELPTEFNKLVEINEAKEYLKVVSPRGAAANSDHYYFFEKGVKSFFTYSLGSYREYHNINDKSENLPLNEYNDMFLLFTEFFDSFEPQK